LTFFFTKTTFSQSGDIIEGFQERIKLLVTKDYDSVIGYTFYRSFSTPPVHHPDSLNNRSHDRNAFLICFKNDSCFAVCIAEYDSGIATSNRILIQEKMEIAKLRKSWPKVRKEHFKPFVYRHSDNGITSYDSLYVLHPVYENLTFRSRKYYKTENFPDAATQEKVSDFENINYKYNASLNLFTVYKSLAYFYNLLITKFEYSK
jgi:hypothetical protein